MTPETLHQLMILVERAVRPVRASLQRKRKMREELLAHVAAVFEEEKVIQADEKRALQRTAERFGASAELTAQLQKSVPRLDALLRFQDFCRDSFSLRAGESRMRGALRQGCQANLLLTTFSLLGGLAILLLVYVLIWDVRRPATREILAGVAGVAIGIVYIMAATFGVILLAHGMAHALHGPAGRSWGKLLLVATASCLVPLSFVGLLLVLEQLDGGRSGQRDLLTLLPGWLAAAPFVFIFGANLRWRFLHEPAGRPWRRTLHSNVLSGLVVASFAWVVALAMTWDWRAAAECACGPLAVMAFWLLPCDLVLSAPSVVGRFHADQEWANLCVDDMKGAAT